MTLNLYQGQLDKLIDLALEEDIGTGDITTGHLVAPDAVAQGTIVAKEELVLAGLDVARRVFQRLDSRVAFDARLADGDTATPGTLVVSIKGKLAALLMAERTALNFLQHLSGIATHVHVFVNALQNRSVRLVDTRKTTPGWRALEKYAVRMGGGANHRMGLFDGVLIKDNHIAACGGIRSAVDLIRRKVSHLTKIEVETSTLDEVREALAAGADVIMLDNMDLEQIKTAVSMIHGRAMVEASGNVGRADLAALAQTGVDVISVGALTHSARAVDLSMRIESR